MKKGSFLRNVLDTIRSNQSAQSGGGGGSSQASGGQGSARGFELYGNQLKASHFDLSQVARHGFPENPSALAFDPVQKIAAIGTRSGVLRVFGRPGVDVWAQHKPECAVTHIRFIVNQGAIITVTADESIHLWSLRGPNLKLQLSANSTTSSSSSPAAQLSPAPNQAASSSAASASASPTATSNSDSGAQPGDPDYLAGDQAMRLSPTGADKNKQYYSKQPEILHTLKFQREHITYLHQTLTSKWLYIGTERGNVHVANVETFELSGYQIAWNKAIELSRKTHPGSIIHISECPQDSNKLLIGYESGCIVLWDLKARNADGRYYQTESLLWLAWHYEGKQFVAAHGDGSLVTWQVRCNTRPAQILQPHAKSPAAQPDLNNQPPPAESFTSASANAQNVGLNLNPSANLKQTGANSSFTASFARSFNNELYRPINKVEWKTSKNNEQFLLFSGGLPSDRLEWQDAQVGAGRSSAASSSLSPQPSHYLKASSPISSPMSPCSSPSLIEASQQQQQQAGSSKSPVSARQSVGHRERKSLRSTSLTVMYGKSITVLEMDDPIIDFKTICDNSPYENDTSDPIAVIVLLANDLILIDLTSSGYPSFESPYPSSSLNESPVTCVQYLADCSSDLIPFLYSTSQNVVSRAPKKGFSDKEWPINGGEWGQAMQSYPELVLTGHADGTIKFWDMSGVNFDLISKIKTSRLFERPNRLPKSIVVSCRQQQQQQINKRPTMKPSSPIEQPIESGCSSLAAPESGSEQQPQIIDNENLFAIEKIEYFADTKQLVVAGALAQVIQFRLKKEAQTNELSTILIDPPSAPSADNGSNNSDSTMRQQQTKHHQLLKVRAPSSANPHSSTSTSGGSSSSSNSQRTRSSGFQAELICLTPLLVSDATTATTTTALTTTTTTSTPISSSSLTQNNTEIAYFCQAAPKVTAVALQATHSILAYAHESGIVLVDMIQKCVILNATLSDLYGGAAMTSASNRDISIQPFATSSILQHHYQASGLTPLTSNSQHSNNGQVADNGLGARAASGSELLLLQHDNAAQAQPGDNGPSALLHKSGALNEAATLSQSPSQFNSSSHAHHQSARAAFDFSQQQHSISLTSQSSINLSLISPQTARKKSHQEKSRFTSNSMFQRQLSTTALTGQQQSSSSSFSQLPAQTNQRLFQRQLTASQLLMGSSSQLTSSSGDGLTNKQRAAALLASTGNLSASSPNTPVTPSHLRQAAARAGRPTAGSEQQDSQQEAAKKPAKNKRIISRMLSISAIHTNLTNDQTSNQSDPAQQQHHHQLRDSSSNGFAVGNGDSAADKIDSSFTRSRSSSSSSQDQQQQQQQLCTAGESIQCLCFLANSQAAQVVGQVQTQSQGNAGKSLTPIADSSTAGQLALWLGTSQGCVLLLSLAMPDSEDNRVLQLQSVSAEPIAQATIKLPGAIKCLATFVSETARVAAPPQAPSGGAQTSSSPSLEGELSLDSQQSSFEARSSTFLAIVSEKQARVYNVSGALTSQQPAQDHQHKPFLQEAAHESPMGRLLTQKANCIAKLSLSDSSFAAKSSLVQMRQPHETCLISYLATGNLVVHSLPHLRALLDADFVPYSEARIAHGMCLSSNGHLLYRPSPGEISKHSLSGQYKALINDMTGALYVAREMPEMPRGNFFKSLFSVSSSAASKQSDRDELFGDCSAAKAATRGVAMHIQSGAMEKLKGAASGSPFSLAREGLDERGEKLGEVEDRTLQMMNQAESYASSAHNLAQKFKDKKWYQF